MKCTKIDDIDSVFREEKRSSLFLVASKDAFLRKVILDKILASLGKDLEVKTYEASGLDIAAMMMEFCGLTFFAAGQMLVITQAEKLTKKQTEALQQAFPYAQKKNILVMMGEASPATAAFCKKVEEKGVLIEVAEEKAWEKEKRLVAWAIDLAASEGKRLPPQVAQQLIKQLGNDQALLSQEIDKLFCYVGENKDIALDDIHAICTVFNTGSIWQLGEAIFRRDVRTAMAIGKGLLEEGTPLLVLLKQLRGQFQTECHVCSILAKGGGGQQVSQEFPYMKGQILEHHLKMAQSYGLDSLRKGLIQLDEADSKARNYVMDEGNFILETLLIQLAHR